MVDTLTGRDGGDIVELIRVAIRQRLLPPGMPLVQAALAGALGVSRIPVREALQYLASEGLVTFTGDGARVTSLRPDEIYELWSLRALIEPAMAEAIARNATNDDIARLRHMVDQMGEETDGDAWSEVNYAFHRELYRVSQLEHYAAVATRLLTQIEPYSRVAVNRLAGQPDAQREHGEIIAALAARDAKALAEVLERHSTRARDLLVSYAEADRPLADQTRETSEAARAFAERLLAAGSGKAGADGVSSAV